MDAQLTTAERMAKQHEMTSERGGIVAPGALIAVELIKTSGGSLVVLHFSQTVHTTHLALVTTVRCGR
jgi:hypothetical protein